MSIIDQAIAESRELESEKDRIKTSGPHRRWLNGMAKNEPRFRDALNLCVGRLRGLAESSLYDAEAKWAASVLGEVKRLLGGR